MGNIRKILRENIEEFNFSDFGISEQNVSGLECNPKNCNCKGEDEHGKYMCKCGRPDKCYEVYVSLKKDTKVSTMVPADDFGGVPLEETLKKHLNKLF